jgi:PAS domain S-box-containing protein
LEWEFILVEIMKQVEIKTMEQQGPQARQVQIAIERAKKEWQATFDAISDLILIADHAGVIQRCNRAVCERFQLAFAELVGQPIHTLFFGENGTASVQEFPAQSEAIQFLRLPGWFEVASYPLQVENGAPQTVYVVKDITERKRVIEALAQSEERFELVSYATNDVVWDLDLSSEVIWWNHNLESRFGYTAEEAQATLAWWRGCIHPEDQANVEASFQRALEAKETFWAKEYHYRQANGSYAYVFDRCYLLYDGQGRAVRAIGAMMDMTQRKQIEEALRESEARHRNLFENSPVALWEADFSEVSGRLDELRRDGVVNFDLFFRQHPDVVIECMKSIKITDMNKATLKLYEAADKEELLSHFSAIISEESYEMFHAELMTITEGHTRFESEGINHTLQGELLNVNVRWIVAPGYEADFSRVLVCVIDLTGSKKMHSQMMEAQKLADVGTLAAGVAHEINSPLQVITGISDSILLHLDQAFTEPQPLQRQLEIIKRNAWRCAEIVRALLTYSRPSAAQTMPNDFNGLIRDGLLLVEHQLQSWSNITVVVDLADNLPLLVCDRNQITQVLINLLTNARDAMPDGGEIVLRTCYDPETNRLCLQVSDNGLGIPDSARSKIFDPFFTTKPIGKGTGLGLSIVAGIVQAHRGTIDVQSQVGRGATFSLYFPTRSAPDITLSAGLPAFNNGRFDDSLNFIPEAGKPVIAPDDFSKVTHV